MGTFDNINYNGENVLEEVKRAVDKSTSEGVLDKDMLDEALIWASRYGQLAAMKYLVYIGADVNANDNEAIKHTGRKGYLEATKYLVSQGADLLTGNNFPVRKASQNNHPQTVKFLVEHKADIEDSNGSGSLNAVQWSFFFVHTELLKYFIEDKGISVNAYDNYAMRCVLSRGRTEIVEYLRRLGAHIDDLDTEIILADENGYSELAEYLRSIKTNSDKS